MDVGITYLKEAELAGLGTLPIYDERLSLLVPDTEEYKDLNSITWKDSAKLPLCLLHESMHERKIVDQAFESVGVKPKHTVTASDSILNLIFHVMFAELVTIIPKHFIRMPGHFPGVKAIDLVEPEISHPVGLVWSPSEPMMPLANVMIGIVKELKKSGELEKRLGSLSVD